MEYDYFINNASDSLIEKFYTDCSKYNDTDGDCEYYFYSGATYWKNTLDQEISAEKELKQK